MNFMEFTKTAKFTRICQAIGEIYKIYSKGYKEAFNEICENYEIYVFVAL